MRRLLVLFLIFSLSLSACSGGGTFDGDDDPTEEASPTSDSAYRGLQLDALGAFSAVFDLQFEGETSWQYQVITRSDGQALEYQLHIEGVSEVVNPGDIRMVSAGGVSRMIGPGTDEACVQFPTDLDLGVSFLSPDLLFDPQEISPSLAPSGIEKVAGQNAQILEASGVRLVAWQDLEVSISVSVSTGAALRYDFRAKGQDPLFDAGEGLLTGQFLVTEIGPQTIDPVSGCEIDLPLPDDAENLIILLGIISFDSPSDARTVALFYTEALRQTDWKRTGPPQVHNEDVLLSYADGVRTLEINIETTAEGVHVDLFVIGP